MSRGKKRLLNEKYAILELMRCPHFHAGASASGFPDVAVGGLEERLAEIDRELAARVKA
jgi:hypothetical protein